MNLRQRRHREKMHEKMRCALKNEPHAVDGKLCNWIDDGVPCLRELPFANAAGHGYVCDVHVQHEMRLLQARQA